jgi:hypothetical protein
VRPRVIILSLLSAALVLASLPVWFVTLMAIIAGRSWSLATGAAGLAFLAGAGAAAYLAYSALQEAQMEDARYHNMQRQVLALAKKNRGTVTVADLINAGFESTGAEQVLDRMSREGICDINLEATELSGIVTYSFPELIPFRRERQETVKE